jgi:hypothetical protein
MVKALVIKCVDQRFENMRLTSDLCKNRGSVLTSKNLIAHGVPSIGVARDC